jgi:hypothetical protein
MRSMLHAVHIGYSAAKLETACPTGGCTLFTAQTLVRTHKARAGLATAPGALPAVLWSADKTPRVSHKLSLI